MPSSPNPKLAREYDDAATAIERFLAGTGGEWDWDDFTSISRRDPFLDSIRVRCIEVHDRFPSPTGYCSAAGEAVLRDLASELRLRANALRSG